MKQLTVSSFLEILERSGLVDRSRLSQTLSDLERDAGTSATNDSGIVSSHLARVGLITDWQRECLLQGRHNGFFLGKYKLLDHLGTGGMSAVYLAEHAVMRRRVALKVLPANRVNDSSYLARFHREARAVASLDHPNIVRAFDVDQDGDYHYLVMEYVEGRDLRVLVEGNGPLDYQLAADYIRQAADGLSHAHQAGLVHRDMKPANLLVDAKGTVKVLDLGLARFDSDDEADASLTKEFDEKMLGTVDYLAPEQAIDSHLVDPRADIYSLGGTLYFALTGHPPFPTGTLAQRVVMHQTKDPKAIEEERPDAPPGLTAIFRKMMAKSPSKRYQTAAEVSQALAEWLQQPNASPAAAKVPRASNDDDDDFKLAPLDDEPKRPGGATSQTASSKPAARPAEPGGARRTASESGAGASQTNGVASRTQVGGGTGPRAAAGKASSSNMKLAPPEGSHSGKAPAGKASPQQASHSATSNSGAAASKSSPSQSRQAGNPSTSGKAAGPAAAGAGNASKTAPQSTPAKATNSAAPQIELPEPDLDAAPLLSGPLDDLLGSLPETDAAASLPLGGASGALGPAKKPVKAKGPSLWDSTWFLIAFGTLLAGILMGLAVLVRWLLG
ncbi:MAG TPA: protein kinase [Pirellulales bacterium]|nr:protein kinase [Pirellulales bacterium]